MYCLDQLIKSIQIWLRECVKYPIKIIVCFFGEIVAVWLRNFCLLICSLQNSLNGNGKLNKVNVKRKYFYFCRID